MKRVKGRFPQKIFLVSALALAACAAGTPPLSADEKKNEKIAGELGGYFVRVKSAISGEKELYYNKDGTLRSSSGDALLGGDFSLDQSLLGDDASDGVLEFGLSAEPLSTEGAPAGEAAPAPSAGGGSPENVPASESAAAAGTRARRSVSAAEAAVPSAPRTAEKTYADDGVDEYSLLRKFSRGRSLENYRDRKVLEMTATDRYGEALSFRDWNGSSVFGMRRFSSRADDYEMRAAGTEADALPLGLFETRSSLAGDRMFVRRSDGLVEVRLNERFAAQGRVRVNTRAMTVRESSGFSMQDINRYQFRRNRSTEPGLPVVSPGGDGTVRRENFGGGNAGLQKK